MTPEQSIPHSEILAALAAPFPIEAVQLKIQTNPKGDADKALVVAYVDARAVAARLNEVVGLDWSTAYAPSATGEGIECRLRIGQTVRADVGTASQTEATKGAYSDAFKRAAVQYGIGAYLYDFPTVKAAVRGVPLSNGKTNYYLTNEAKADLVTLRERIHASASSLPRFNHIAVAGYRPLFGGAS